MQFIKDRLQHTMYTNNVQLKYIPKYVPILSNRTYIDCTDELLVGHMELCHYAKNCSELGCIFFSFTRLLNILCIAVDAILDKSHLLDLIAFWIWGAFYFQTNTEHHFPRTLFFGNRWDPGFPKKVPEGIRFQGSVY